MIVDPTPDGPPRIVRDSFDIALYLDKTYPDPERTLFPPGSHALQALALESITNKASRTDNVPLT